MVAAIELGKEYIQICVKTEMMKEPESVTKVAGAEHYRMPTEANIEDAKELQELFRKLWKMIASYGSRESLEYLFFCLEEPREDIRKMLLDIVKIYNIPAEIVRFAEKEECFASYVIHQSGDLLSHNALLIDHRKGEKSKWILHKKSHTMPTVTMVRDISEKSLEDVFTEHGISSVFLVGDDYEEEWMAQNLKLLKTGKRVFAGKNLFVKGACYLACDLQEKRGIWIYLGADKVDCNIALKTENRGKVEFLTIVEGGRNWYESHVELEVLLLDEPSLEFAMYPINGRDKMTAVVHLNHLPDRPKRTTRLNISLEFKDSKHAKLVVKDMGFGELFPQSDMIYEGELQWEQ